MPRRTDLKRILVIGSGPIVIGQACEFDYSGTQACKALRKEGYEVVLVNSNPATIMTDPSSADRVYIEPIELETLTQIIEKERPDALLPTLGGQTALNAALALYDAGVLAQYEVEMIGVSVASIRKAEDRELFRQAMEKIGLQMPRSRICRTADQIRACADDYQYPLILRPSYTLGGTGGSICESEEQLEELARAALDASPTREVLVDESILGWKEYELELVRDGADNVVVVCSIENLDPMGVHTGDSITVAPAQTLTARAYDALREAAIACVREVDVRAGGSNVQFGVCPQTGRVVVIEMNPRVSRSSALASKATGYPIAKISALLAVGYTLDELPNDFTQVTSACVEPSLDYVVAKLPRFTFEKFPTSPAVLGTQMKSVGEVMAIGRTFQEAMQKALCSLEMGWAGFEPRLADAPLAHLEAQLGIPSPERVLYVLDGMRQGLSDERLFELTKIDPWFLAQLRGLYDAERSCQLREGRRPSAEELRALKRMGFSDARLAALFETHEDTVRGWREADNILPVFKSVDTCAGLYGGQIAYLYSSYESEPEGAVSDRPKVMILGGGPNRIGQGIEFDYCCVHASMALQEAGYETIMVNCNPETVSTDYDTSDRLYFEPLSFEHVYEIVRRERPKGLIVQYGGQTPLKLARRLERAGVPILGTTPDAIDRAEDRGRFAELLHKLGLRQPENGIARTPEQALQVARGLIYPLVVRPSYVLGGRAMEVVLDETQLVRYITEAVQVSEDHPVLLDRFVAGAIELDVDCVCDGERVVIGGVMQHVEEAGVHSGDSASSLPPFSVPAEVVAQVEAQTEALALGLGVVGLMNVQFAVQLQGDAPQIYVLEVNPRASRTVPFVSKAIGQPLAKIGARVMAGESLKDLNFTQKVEPKRVAVKESVFPFVKFGGQVDPILGPEMRSTGEVMGLAEDFPTAFLKSQKAAYNALPREGTVLMSADDLDKEAFVALAQILHDLGFELLATDGTADVLAAAMVPSLPVNKVHELGDDTVRAVASHRVQLVMCTTRDLRAMGRDAALRQAAIRHGVPYFTTLAGAQAAVAALQRQAAGPVEVLALQDAYLP